MDIHQNLLLIGGSSQNVGKTTFTIDLLKRYSTKHNIIAIKTSCHFHGILDTDVIIANNNKFVIVKETVTNTGKDSALMLKAGAKEVYFIQAKDEFIGEAYSYLTDKIDKNNLIICETASLRKHLVPIIFLALIKNKSEKLDKSKIILEKANYTIENYLGNKEKFSSTVEIINNEWKLNTQKKII